MESSEIYWILQLDNIHTVLTGGFFFLISFATLVGFFISAGLLACKSGVFDSKDCTYPGDWLLPIISCSITAILTIIVIIILAISMFLPSSKNMAVIHILPKIVNNEELKIEAKELYDLAKQGLKDLVTKDFKEKKIRKNMMYTVWAGGVEVNDNYLTKEQAKSLAQEYIVQGYDDVLIEQITEELKDELTDKHTINPETVKILDAMDAQAEEREGVDNADQKEHMETLMGEEVPFEEGVNRRIKQLRKIVFDLATVQEKQNAAQEKKYRILEKALVDTTAVIEKLAIALSKLNVIDNDASSPDTLEDNLCDTCENVAWCEDVVVAEGESMAKCLYYVNEDA